MTPGVRHLTALDHDVIKRPLGEEVAGGEAGVSCAYDDRREAFDQATSTETSVGFVSASNTAERF